MSTFNLGLPTDIQWKRICVTEDMMDPVVCDDERLPNWQPSMAIFRYDPADEYQPWNDPTSYLKDYAISYLKVAVSITPFDDNLTAMQISQYVSVTQVDKIKKSRPCHGALLQVAISPTDADITAGTYQLKDYPYFADFEPKKRELYEMRSETGEVLGGSHDTVAVGKSAARSKTTETMSRFGANIGFGIPGIISIGGEGEGSVRRSSGYETQDVSNTTLSTERRETQSHTTQLSQLYNLLQGYHLGTNRAMFLMEPRPHIVATDVPTFINGPRALEGIQEVFLVVIRPKDMADFCVNVHLETAHVVSGKELVVKVTSGPILPKVKIYYKDISSMYLVGRDLCCCPESPSPVPVEPYVTYERHLKDEYSIKSYEGPATEEALLELRRTAKVLKEEMLNSIGSPARYNNGDVPYVSSDTFLSTVNSVLHSASNAPELSKSLSVSALLPPADRDRLVEVYGDISVGSVMAKNANEMSHVLGKTIADTLALKGSVLQAASPGFTPPVGVIQPRNITAVQISTSYPDPQSPRELASMSDPTEVLSVEAIDGPDVIEIIFNDTPDAGTVSSQTLVVVQGGQVVTGAVTSPTPSTGRFTASQPLAPGLYGVRVLGNGSSTVTFNSVPLDGEPISLPTGDGVAGGDFHFVLEVQAAT